MAELEFRIDWLKKLKGANLNKGMLSNDLWDMACKETAIYPKRSWKAVQRQAANRCDFRISGIRKPRLKDPKHPHHTKAVKRENGARSIVTALKLCGVDLEGSIKQIKWKDQGGAELVTGDGRTILISTRDWWLKD
jgi:hypothetical protein